MKIHSSAILLTLILSFIRFADSLNWFQYFRAKYLISQYIRSQTTPIPEPHLNLVPGLVRLVFHDCSGKNCDGCINPNHPFNGRVVPVVNALEPLFNKVYFDGFSIKNVMSRADFWALGSIQATKIAVRLNNIRCKASGAKKCRTKRLRLPFKYGRKDCPTSPFYTSNNTPVLPSAFLNNTETLSFFKDNFGFDARESTYIMGGHSLGFSANTTSLPGVWEIGNTDGFGNRFFKNMLNQNLNWRQAKKINSQGGERWRWIGDNGAFGLDTDINLVRDITVNPITGKASSYYTSPKSPTYQHVKKLANPKYFAKHYAKTFIKMISLGNVELSKPSFFW